MERLQCASGNCSLFLKKEMTCAKLEQLPGDFWNPIRYFWWLSVCPLAQLNYPIRIPTELFSVDRKITPRTQKAGNRKGRLMSHFQNHTSLTSALRCCCFCRYRSFSANICVPRNADFQGPVHKPDGIGGSLLTLPNVKEQTVHTTQKQSHQFRDRTLTGLAIRWLGDSEHRFVGFASTYRWHRR